jgi:hypothetical protein
MDFFYQPYLLQSRVPHEPYFELDIANLYPDNPSDNIHWFDSQNHKKNLFYNYLRIPIIVQSVSEDNRQNLHIKDLIKKNIVSAFDSVFNESERNENWHLAEELLNLVSNNSFDIYDASLYFETAIQDKCDIIYIEAYENEHLFTQTVPLKNPIEIEGERLEIRALVGRIAFLHELGIMDFLEKKWKFIKENNELLENETGYAKLLAVFMNIDSEKIRNVIKDGQYRDNKNGKKAFDEIIGKLGIIKKI